jgi:hypothetical protein
MPILKFYTSPGQLTDEEKQELVTTLTAGYTKIMPDFFVNIMFHEVCFFFGILHWIPYHPMPDMFLPFF